MKKIDFDEVVIIDSFIDSSKIIAWFKDNKEIKRLKFDPIRSSINICSTCLKNFGKIVGKSKRITIRQEGEEYTFDRCPDCDSWKYQECSCLEKPHRAGCVLGFDNYFPMFRPIEEDLGIVTERI